MGNVIRYKVGNNFDKVSLNIDIYGTSKVDYTIVNLQGKL